MTDRALFVRMYRAFASGLSTVQAVKSCITISRVDPARYEVPYPYEMGTCIWGLCYNSAMCATGISAIFGTGKNINSRFRFKFKASYIVSTEGDVRRVNNG